MKYNTPKKAGWFVGRTYRHFDRPLSFKNASNLVKQKSVINHDFRPLISYEVIERRFKGFDENGKAIVKHKPRLICKAAHRDSQIYAFYAYHLENKYSDIRKKLGLDDCVLAYRSGKGCNIHMANDVFEAIKGYESCSVIAMDISGFFDNIDHQKLKQKWCQVINEEKLPDDHFKLFKSLTKFSRVDQSECLSALGLQEKDLRKSTNVLCTDAEFHKLICKRGSDEDSLIIKNAHGRNPDNSINWKNFGIPQGTPMSAVLSNIFMIDFDLTMEKMASEIGGVYRRYSDDILFICPQEFEERVHDFIVEEILKQGENLKINQGKTELARFQRVTRKYFKCLRLGKDGEWRPGYIQYLGFNFDGKHKSLRNQTISRFHRKRKYAVRGARRDAEYFKKDKIRSKKLYRDLTDIGSRSMPSYAKRAANIMEDNAPIRQLKHHKADLKLLLKKQNAILRKKRNIV